MTDKSKEIYNEMMSRVEPEKTYLEKLTQTLEKEKRNRMTVSRYIRVAVSAAACIAIVSGSVVMLAKRDKSREEELLKLQLGTENPSVTGFITETEETDDKYIGKFVEHLCSDDLLYIYKSDNGIFVDENKISDEEIINIKKLFENASVADDTEISENKVYYMSVFGNGDIVKFNISDDGCIEIPSRKIFLK